MKKLILALVVAASSITMATDSFADSWGCPLATSVAVSMSSSMVLPSNEAVFTVPYGGSADVKLESDIMFRTSLDGFMSKSCLDKTLNFGGKFVVSGVVYPAAGANAGYLTSSARLRPGRYSVSVIGTTNFYGTGEQSYYSSERFLITVKEGAPPPPPPGPVIGNLDSAGVSGSNFVVSGWTCDKHLPKSIDVHLYLGGPAGVGTLVMYTNANIANEGAVDRACETSGVGHRFQFTAPISETLPHSGKPVYLYGISGSGGTNPSIGSFVLP